MNIIRLVPFRQMYSVKHGYVDTRQMYSVKHGYVDTLPKWMLTIRSQCYHLKQILLYFSFVIFSSHPIYLTICRPI